MLAAELSERLGESVGVKRIGTLRRNLGITSQELRTRSSYRWDYGMLLSEFAVTDTDVILDVRDVEETVDLYQKIGGRAMLQASGDGTASVGRFRLTFRHAETASAPRSFVVFVRSLSAFQIQFRSERLPFLERETSDGSGRELVVSDPEGNQIILRLHKSIRTDRFRFA